MSDQYLVEAASRGPVLVVDDQAAFGAGLARSFRELGYDVDLAADYGSAQEIADKRCPKLIVTELRIGPKWVLDAAALLRSRVDGCRGVVVTSYPSVATAIRSVKLGFEAYLAKPVTAQMVLGVVDAHDNGSLAGHEAVMQWPSLDRTIWEYLNQAYSVAGSLSETARRLGLDRRSLRRMLSKYPPAR